MKFNKGQILKNVSSSWFSLGVNVVTGFILSPFIVHHLGDRLLRSVRSGHSIFDRAVRGEILRHRGIGTTEPPGQHSHVQLQRDRGCGDVDHLGGGVFCQLDFQDPA